MSSAADAADGQARVQRGLASPANTVFTLGLFEA
jgi:hypothetical protein